MRYPNTNIQRLITTVVALVAITILLWLINSSFLSQNTVSISGSMSGGTINQTINNNTIDTNEIATQLAEKLGVNPSTNLQQKDEEIQRLTKTIERLQQQAQVPGNELKQAALEKLEENKPQEASNLLKQSIAERTKVRQELTKQEAQDWVDVGNIAYLNNTQEALEAYQQALALDSNNIEAQSWLGAAQLRLGKLDEAIQTYETVLALAGSNQTWQAVAYGNLGIINQIRGNFDKAEVFHLIALKINETLGHQTGIAIQYGNLGLIYQIRGDLDKAESFNIKSLKINEMLGHQAGIAMQYGNLGLIYQIRGNLDKAESFHIKSLKIAEALNRKEYIAIQCGNLALIYRIRGDLDKAEAFTIKH